MAIEHLVEDAEPLLGQWLPLYFLIRVIREGDPTNSLISLAKVSILEFLKKSQLSQFPSKLLSRFVGSQLNLDLETCLYLQPHRRRLSESASPWEIHSRCCSKNNVLIILSLPLFTLVCSMKINTELQCDF